MYNFQIQNEKFYPITTLLSRSYPGIFSNFFEVNEQEFCKRLNINEKELENQLKFMEKWGVLDIEWKSDSPKITFSRERMPYDYLEIKPEVYHYRKEIASSKLNAVIDYLEDDRCRSVKLINYFGLTSSPCGKCDNCKKKLQNNSTKESEKLVLGLLTESPKNTEEIKFYFSDYQLFKSTIRDLMLNEKIIFDGSHYRLS